MSAGSAYRTKRAAGGWLRPGSSCASLRSLASTTSGGCDPMPSILASPLEREGEYWAFMKTGGAAFGSQPRIAFGYCDGTGAQRRSTHIRKLNFFLRLETPPSYLQKIGQAIYGQVIDSWGCFATRMIASSFSLPSTSLRQAPSSACFLIANSVSGLASARAALYGLTTRRQSARRPLLTQSPKGFQAIGCGALLRTIGDAST